MALWLIRMAYLVAGIVLGFARSIVDAQNLATDRTEARIRERTAAGMW